MARLTIRLLGSFQVNLENTPLMDFDSNKVRALLAYLAVEQCQIHSREKLATLFWHEMTAKRAKSNLSAALYNLRNLIQDHQAEPPYLLRLRQNVQFNSESDHWLDLDLVKDQLDGNQRTDLARLKTDSSRLESLQAAVDLYRGDFLEGLSFDSSLAFDEWVMIRRQRLQQQVLEALHLLAAYFASVDELPKALTCAWRQVALDPLDERASRQLMSLLADNNQRSQALTQFERLRVMLAEELGVAPAAETVALWDQIRGEVISPVQASSRGDNLPGFLTTLVGRREELKELGALICDPTCRLLTILGPGGSGKSRLALEVARASLDDFRHGVYFVPLNPVQAPESILPTIADALQLPRSEDDDIQIQLANFLRKRDLLLLLDGFEHLLEGANLLADLLQQAKELKILITSRARLHIKGEQLYLLAGMRYPDRDANDPDTLEADAVRLLISGLQRAQAGYKPAPGELPYMLQVCRQVQGMPLGILLAASWGATFSMDEIAESVSRSLDFLTADWTDVPDRQRSLRATFDHTWNLIDEDEKRIFQSLSVFRGAFTRQAARKVSGASPHDIRALLERSLLDCRTPGWYVIHELLRQYGREKLAQSAQAEQEVGGRHSEHYLGQLARLGEDLKSAQQTTALSSIDLEHENYRTAWNWASSQDAAAQLHSVVDTLCLYYDLSLRYSDGESACRTALDGRFQEQAGADLGLLQGRLFTWQSRFTRLLGQAEVASQLLVQAAAHIEKTKGVGVQAGSVEAFLALEQGNNHFNNDRAAAATSFRHSLEIYRSLEDVWGTAQLLGRLGLLAYHTGSFKEAGQAYSKSLDLYRSLGDPRGIANALIELGHIALQQGKISAGQAYMREGTDILRQIGDRAGVARAFNDLGRSHIYAGQYDQGLKLVLQSEPILEDLGMLDQLVESVIGIGTGFSHLGRYDDAIAQANRGLPIARDLDARREIAMAYVVLGEAYLGKRQFEQSLEYLLESITHYQEIDQKGELSWPLGYTLFARRGLNQAEANHETTKQVLRIGVEVQGYLPIIYALCGVALQLLDQGEKERAVELAALAWRYPAVSKSQLFHDVAGREISAAADSLPPDLVAAAQERGRARDIWETATELLDELSDQVDLSD